MTTETHTDEQAPTTIGWAILELMGHRRLAGYVTEQEVAGHGMLRIEIPGASDEAPTTTQFYSPSSLYCLTPTTKEVAKVAARSSRPAPIHPWELTAGERPEVEF